MISGQYIKKLAENAGFDLCGITPCKHLAENESYFREWLAKGYGSSLEYLERNLDKRFDVRHLVEGAQTVVVCAVSYKNPLGEGYPPGCRTKIASYARSRDYHPVLKRMLGTMLEALRRQYPGLTGRTFVDTAPLLENNWPSKRVWAGSGGNPCCSRPNTAPMSCWASWYLPCRPTNTMPRSQEPVAAAAGTAWTVVRREPSSRPR